jgi:hypothetical protein
LWDDSADAAGPNLADLTPAVAVPALAPPGMHVPTFPPVVAPVPAPVPAPALAPAPACPRTPTPTLVPAPTVALNTSVVWPVDTDLVYVPGTTKIMLTAQRPVMRTVIQEAFEYVHASLLISCAMPDASVVPSIIKDALVLAASLNVPRASSIYGRLMMDEEYTTQMSRLVSPFMCRLDPIRLITFFSRALGFLFSERMSRSIVRELYR